MPLAEIKASLPKKEDEAQWKGDEYGYPSDLSDTEEEKTDDENDIDIDEAVLAAAAATSSTSSASSSTTTRPAHSGMSKIGGDAGSSTGTLERDKRKRDTVTSEDSIEAILPKQARSTRASFVNPPSSSTTTTTVVRSDGPPPRPAVSSPGLSLLPTPTITPLSSTDLLGVLPPQHLMPATSTAAPTPPATANTQAGTGGGRGSSPGLQSNPRT